MGCELIVALNTNEKEEALRWVDQLEGVVDFFKVGLPLYLRYGKEIINELRNRDLRIFLDLKLHDIPSVVRQSIEDFEKGEVEFITCHIAGGKEMLIEAKEAAKERNIKIAGVTVLTSIDRYMLQRFLGHYLTLEDVVRNMLKVATEASIDLAVVSGRELKLVHDEFGDKMEFIVPGIRLKGEKREDQRRVVTPREAVSFGARYIVVGRPITHSEHPARKAEEFLKIIKA